MVQVLAALLLTHLCVDASKEVGPAIMGNLDEATGFGLASPWPFGDSVSKWKIHFVYPSLSLQLCFSNKYNGFLKKYSIMSPYIIFTVELTHDIIIVCFHHYKSGLSSEGVI